MIETEARVTKLEERTGALEKRADKTDDILQRVHEQQTQHRESQIRTETMVGTMSRDIGDVKIAVSKLSDSHSKKWEKFWERALWAVLGVIGSVIAIKFGK